STRSLYCFAVSPKRYATYTYSGSERLIIPKATIADSGLTIFGEDSVSDSYSRPIIGDEPDRDVTSKSSEHGLGLYSDPRNLDDRNRKWYIAAWDYILRYELDTEEPAEPYWFERPAVVQRTISTPMLLKVFDPTLEMRPFTFVNHSVLHGFDTELAAVLRTPQTPTERRIDLVAPFESDPSEWIRSNWFDSHTGGRCTIIPYSMFSGIDIPNRRIVKDYGQVIHTHRTRDTPTMLPPDEDGRGVLRRRYVRDLSIGHIGKESNNIDQLHGIPTVTLSETETQYHNPKRGEWASVILPALRCISLADAAEAFEVNEDRIKKMRSGRIPRAGLVRVVVPRLAALARDRLDLSSSTPDREAVAALRDHADKLGRVIRAAGIALAG
ncbi:MAG: hypothetical protein ACREP9_02210, partial [Candidatus Dormibacteraceae bacterium]